VKHIGSSRRTSSVVRSYSGCAGLDWAEQLETKSRPWKTDTASSFLPEVLTIPPPIAGALDGDFLRETFLGGAESVRRKKAVAAEYVETGTNPCGLFR
jgi:hypothetical protein